MENSINIKNQRNYTKLLTEQLGQIVGIEIGLIICAFFVNLQIVLSLQIIALPIILILIFAKYTKPIISVRIDLEEKTFYFVIAKFGRNNRTIIIPFSNIQIVKRRKWLLNAYEEVLDIKNGDILKIVNPANRANANFVNQFLSEIYKLRDANILKDYQIKVKG